MPFTSRSRFSVGSYGGGDPGIFFFLTNGTKVVTSLDYIQTDQPIPGVAAPKLGG